jgi:phage-related protein
MPLLACSFNKEKMASPKPNRQIIYLGSSRKDAEKLPRQIQDLFSDALMCALMGQKHEDAKPFKYHGGGVFEVVGDHRNDTFRAIYTTKYTEVVFVIHIFQKKSKRGKETPKEDKELIENRLKWAEQVYKEQYGKKAKKN